MTVTPGGPPPPESWPGAAGRRSVAPDVPGWPGAAPRSATPGGSWPGRGTDGWPGAGGPSAGAVSTAPAATAQTASLGEAARSGGVAAILFPMVLVLLVLGAIGLWARLDDGHRAVQGYAVVVVIVVAVAALVVSILRHRDRG